MRKFLWKPCVAAVLSAGLLACDSGSSKGDDVGESDGNDSTAAADAQDATDAADGAPGSDATDAADAADGAPGSDATDGTDGVDGGPSSDSTDATDGVDGGPGSDATDGTDGSTTWPSTVTLLKVDGAGKASATGNVGDGAVLGAAWMLEPGVHCLSGTTVSGSSAKLYQKNQVLFALDAPLGPLSRITAKVTAVTGDPRVYLVALPKGVFATPPNLETASACAARYNPGYDSKPVTAGWTNETAGEYEILIGVAGGDFDKNFSTADFTLDVTVTGLADACHDVPFDDLAGDTWSPPAPAFWPDFVTPLTVSAEGVAQIQAQLSEGLPLCEHDFAFDSNVACFPEPQVYLYTGNHQFYSLDLPKAGVVTVTITPDPGVDVSAYGLQMGTTSWYTPPHVPTAICEQSPKKNFGTVGGAGQAETLTFVSTGNPYHLLLAITGPDGANEGGYTIDVDMKLAAEDACGDLWSQAKLAAWPTKATEWYPAATSVKPDGTGKAVLSGDLSAGKELCSLGFAWQSNVTCFPATQAAHFGGNHTFYTIDGGVGAGQTLTVTVTPKSGSVDVSLYGYWMSQGSFYVPPNVVSVGNCEASHAQTLDGSGNPGSPESIYFENPGGNAYNYFFAVAGPEGVTSGAYDITVTRTTPPPPYCPESLPGTSYTAWPSNLASVELDANGEGTFSGNLADGACTNLSFANSSQTACFPATQNERFEGNQVFHVVGQVMPPHSVLDITVTPKAGVDVSVYGYMLGTTNFMLPPNVPSALACEASYATSVAGNPGGVETLHFENPTPSNSYQVFFAVSGVSGVKTGTYDVEVQMDVAEPFCPESLPGTSYASWPASVTQVTEDGGGQASVTGNLSAGGCANLEFGAESDVACFPATEFDNFQGPQVFYALKKALAPGEVVDIAVTPAPEADVSLYGYQTAATSFLVPPKVTSVISCEASYDAQTSFNPGETEYIHFENPTSNSYNIFFAVTGTAISASGAYTIEVSRQIPPPPHCAASLPGQPNSAWPASVKTVTLDSNGAGTATGNLNTGACTNLDFASDSDTACFPATQNDAFEGNHVFYTLSKPLPPGSVAAIEVVPAAGVDVSLLGYTLGTSSYFTPPYVPSVSVCEASYSTSGGDPGESEWITFQNPTGNSYNVLFSVAGPAGVTSGAYTVNVTVDTAEPWCPQSLPGASGLAAWPANVKVLTLAGTTATASSTLQTGACTDLAFAWDSSNACFPATQADEFEGNQVFYALAAPVAANKTVTITVDPGPQADVSVYGYRTSTTSFYVPPYVPSTVDCEYGAAGAKGADETITFGPSGSTTPYNVFFAVSGSNGAAMGNYSVTVTVN